MNNRPKHVPAPLREVPSVLSAPRVQLARQPGAFPPRSPAPHVQAVVARVAQACLAPARRVAPPRLPAPAPSPRTVQPFRTGIIQRNGTSASTIHALMEMGAIAVPGESESSASTRLHHFMAGHEPALVAVTRDTFDQNGKATFTALAAQCGAQKIIEGKTFAVVDLKDRFIHTPLKPLFMYLYQAIQGVEVNYKNGPLHRNEEGKLPVADNEWRYIECYYAGGGTRLVVDVKTWTAYATAHYSTFYVIVDSGQNPANQKQPLVTECRILANAYRTGNWTGFSTVYPRKVEELLKKG